MAVVQDDAAAAGVEPEPRGAAFVPLEASRAGSVAASLREGSVRHAGRPPAVVCHPVRDRVCDVGGLVSGPAEPLPDRGDELLLLGGAAGRDRILHEALATGAGPFRLALVFNIDHTNAMAYASAARNLLSSPAGQAPSRRPK